MEDQQSPCVSQKTKALILGLTLLFGVLCRVSQYTFNRSLWYDEALNARKIIEYSLSDIFFFWKFSDQIILYQPPYPLGFYLLEKWAIAWGGANETALRFFPFLAGTAALFFFLRFTRIFLKEFKSIFFAAAVFAGSERLVYYSAEVKGYSFDVLLAILLTIVFIRLKSHPIDKKMLCLSALAGAAAMWFSYPVVFILAGGIIVLGVKSLHEKNLGKFKSILIIGLIWMANFAIVYCSYAGRADPILADWWRRMGTFLPIYPIHQYGVEWYTFKWYFYKFFNLFENPVGLSIKGLAGLVFCLGCRQLWMTQRAHFGFLFTPIGLTLMASALHKYPFHGRMLCFLTPAVIVILAAGLEWISNRFKKSGSILSWVLITILLFQPVTLAWLRVQSPQTVEEIKPVLNYIRNHWKQGDHIYVYWPMQHAFYFYAPRYQLTEDEYQLGTFSWRKQIDFAREFNRFQGQPRLWVLFGHVYGSDEMEGVRYLEHMGKKQDFYRAPGVKVYLFDLSP